MVLIAFVLFEPMGLYGRWLKCAPGCSSVPVLPRGLFKRQKSFQKSDRLKMTPPAGRSSAANRELSATVRFGGVLLAVRLVNNVSFDVRRARCSR